MEAGLGGLYRDATGVVPSQACKGGYYSTFSFIPGFVHSAPVCSRHPAKLSSSAQR